MVLFDVVMWLTVSVAKNKNWHIYVHSFVFDNEQKSQDISLSSTAADVKLLLNRNNFPMKQAKFHTCNLQVSIYRFCALDME